jgi:hypothetical protein
MGASLAAGNSGIAAGVAIKQQTKSHALFYHYWGVVTHATSKLTNLIHVESDFGKIKSCGKNMQASRADPK